MAETDGQALAKRDKPWIFRTYAGHSTARELNRLYRQNLAKGQTGLSIAFDLPTQTGYDSDHILARGEVGKVGVAISHIGDMRALFEEIPLASMNTSMTINATAPWLMALYIAVADEQGAPRAELQGTTQNDIIKEYLARGSYVFPPDASLRLTKDLILFCAREAPKWNPMNVCSYHLQEAGATPVQELSYALATAIAVLERVRQSGEVDETGFANVVGRMSFFVNAGMRFVTELAKMRAFVELWDEITRDRFGVQDPSKRRFRYGVQVNSLGLTEQQPENNAYRILIEMLSVVLSKGARARAVQLPAWNEALGLPRPFDQQWSLRLQQIMAYETDLLEFGDIFEGSREIATLVAKLKTRGAGRDRRHRRDGRRGHGDRNGRAEGQAGRIQHPPARGDRARRADRGRRQRLHQFRAVAADRRRELDPGPLSRGGGRAGRPAQGVARAARRGARPRGAQRRCASRGHERRQHHAGLDRGRQGRRDDRRMGRRAACGVRRIPRADRRLADARGRQAADLDPLRGEVERVSLKLGRRIKFLVGKPGLDGHSNGAEQIAARATDAGMDVVYDGIRLTPAEIVEAARAGRPLRRPVDPVGVAYRADRRSAESSCARPDFERVPLIVGGIIPPDRRRAAARGGRRRRLHAEGFRDQRHPRRDRLGNREAFRRGSSRAGELSRRGAPQSSARSAQLWATNSRIPDTTRQAIEAM